MINPEDRLWAGSGGLFPGGPYTWHITDFDQRRHFSVTYCNPAPIPDEDVEGTEDLCLAQLRRHIDDLGADVLGIRFSDPEGPISISVSQDDDVTMYANCYPPTELRLPFPAKTVGFGSLTELDRMGPQVDLVTYPATPAAGGQAADTKAAFKYWFIQNGMFWRWHELQLWARLPRDHPHIVPFDAVVLDDIRGGVIGFTSIYIPGGTLQDTNATVRPFRLVWFQQLLSVVDDLNHRYGIMHQDIAARNLVVDVDDNLRIFDFNFSNRISEHYDPHRDDVKGVIFTLYEIVTLDEHYREAPHAEQDAEALLQRDWTKHPDVKLDSEVYEFRKVLDAWVEKRRTQAFEAVETWLQWPPMPDPPLAPSLTFGPDGAVTGREMKAAEVLTRRNLIRLEEPYLKWERPAGYRLRDMLEKQGRQKEMDVQGTNTIRETGKSVDEGHGSQ
ncbi:Protein kinase-like domain [Cordyceps javanica]|uniref:EKC/KEOPS complex subunit BUD32 n=1 Tax=Cordyceps javanica TaxID=43265 RepID=A0A545UW60_9HYPO|nr:Protein kinase-like domain [Cordyceps javanica]TQW04497.1 Protein kinase-like domain [Cordyceps javanica]